MSDLPSEAPLTPTRADLDKHLSDALAPHPWLADWIERGIAPDLDAVGAAAALNALYGALGGVIDALYVLADAIDRHNEPPKDGE
jgi:hypothetical protein